MALAFAGSSCNNILHCSFVSIHYIKNIILSFQFLVTNVEGMYGHIGLVQALEIPSSVLIFLMVFT